MSASPSPVTAAVTFWYTASRASSTAAWSRSLTPRSYGQAPHDLSAVPGETRRSRNRMPAGRVTKDRWRAWIPRAAIYSPSRNTVRLEPRGATRRGGDRTSAPWGVSRDSGRLDGLWDIPGRSPRDSRGLRRSRGDLPASPPYRSRSARRLAPGQPAVSLPVSSPSRSRSARRLARQQEQGVGGERGVVGNDAPADHRLQVRAAEPLAAQVLLLDLQVRLARGEALRDEHVETLADHAVRAVQMAEVAHHLCGQAGFLAELFPGELLRVVGRGQAGERALRELPAPHPHRIAVLLHQVKSAVFGRYDQRKIRLLHV